MVLFLGVATAPAWGQPPATTAGDYETVVYPDAIANSGLVQVYIGTSGKYVRTTPLRLESYELSDDGSQLNINVSVKLAEEEQADLEKQMKIHEDIHASAVANAPQAAHAPRAVTASDLIWITPHTVTVRVLGPNGKKELGQATQDNKAKDGTKRPLLLNKAVAMSFAVPLDEPIKDRSQVVKYRVTLEAVYNVRKARREYAAFQLVATALTSSLESALGGVPEPQDYVARNVAQQVASSQSVTSSVTSINANADQQKIILAQLEKSLAEPKNPDVTSLPDKWVVWTPELGRLDVTPTQKNLVETERSLKMSAHSAFSKKAKSLSAEARKFENFDQWYNEQQRKRKTGGSGSGSLETEANIFDMFRGGAGATAAYKFDKNVDDLDVASGERKRYEDLHTWLEKEQEVSDLADSNFEQYWKGHNTIVDYQAKKFNLAVGA